MSSNAISSHYTRLLREGAVIAEITSIDEFGITRDDTEVSHYDSDDQFKEFIGGLADGGTFSFTGNFIGDAASNQDHLQSDSEDGTVSSYELVLPNEANSSWEIQAYVNKYTNDSPIGEAIKFNCTLKVSGKPTMNVNDGSTGLTTPFFTLAGVGFNTIFPSPSASGSIYLYSATAQSDDHTITIVPTASSGIIHLNGTIVTSGIGGTVSIATGETLPVFISVKESAKSPKIYKVNIYRP